MAYKELVYVAHPFGGLPENREKINKIMVDLVLRDKSRTYVSPIHNYGFMYMDGDKYQEGLDICLDLLDHCDIVLMCGDYRNSRGCKGELARAKENGLPAFNITEWLLYLERETEIMKGDIR